MLTHSITDVIYETFSVSISHKDEQTGVVTHKDIALIHKGEQKDVTDDNKLDYIRLLVQWKTHYSVCDLPLCISPHRLFPHFLSTFSPPKPL